MDKELKNIIAEIEEIRELFTPYSDTTLKLAVQIQRNKILKEGLANIYSILKDK